MTQREKVLATTLVVILTVFGGGAVFHMFVYKPLTDVKQRLQRTREELAKKQSTLLAAQKEIEAAQRVNPRLKLWQKLSLPPRDPEMPLIRPDDARVRRAILVSPVAVDRVAGTLRSPCFNGRNQ